EHGDDRDLPAAGEEVAQEDGLEFDGVLRAVSQLRAKAVLPRPLRQRLRELAVDGYLPKGALVVLPRQRKRVLHPDMAGAEDDEQVGVAPLREVTIGPGVSGPAAVKVDVRRNDAGHSWLAAAVAVDGSRALGRREKAVEQGAHLGGIQRVGAAAVRRRACRRLEEGAVDPRTALGEARAVEEALFVQGGGGLHQPLT